MMWTNKNLFQLNSDIGLWFVILKYWFVILKYGSCRHNICGVSWAGGGPSLGEGIRKGCLERVVFDTDFEG